MMQNNAYVILNLCISPNLVYFLIKACHRRRGK
jgi:hypothetical protein